MNYRYFVFGLHIESTVELPELLKSEQKTLPDVSIYFGKTPENLPNCQKKGVAFEVAMSEFLLDLKGIARFYVANGNEIIVEPKESGNKDDIRNFLLGSCFGALLHQRKILAIHASAIIHQGKAVLFTGLSGIGKSTTANAFRLEGYKMLTDDICPIKFVDNKPFALPGYPLSKLWEDSLKQLRIDYKHLNYIRADIPKRKVSISSNFSIEPIEVKAIYLLESHHKATVKLENMKNTGRFQLIRHMTYRKSLIKGMGMQSYHFKNCMQLANQIEVKRIYRPIEFSLSNVVEIIKADLTQEIHV